MKYSMRVLVTIVLGLWFSVNGESILSLEVNIPDGVVYAISDNFTLYELYKGEFDRSHTINFTTAPTYSSTFLYENNNGKLSLFQAMSDFNVYNTYIIKLNLPFNNRRVLYPAAASPPGYGYTDVPTTYDSHDKIALTISNGNFINLFSLKTLNKTDDERLFMATKNAGTAVSYNYKNNRAVVFLYSFYQSSRRYNMYVQEYLVSGGSDLVQVDTTFAQLQGAPYYPFSNSVMNYAEFDDANNKFWALDSKTPRMVSFNAHNLSAVTFIPLPGVTFDSEFGTALAVYNFAAQLAYVFSDGTNGFHFTEVDLFAKTVRRSKEFNTGGTPAATAKVNVAEGNIYVGLIEPTPESAPRISIIQLADLSQTIITL